VGGAVANPLDEADPPDPPDPPVGGGWLMLISCWVAGVGTGGWGGVDVDELLLGQRDVAVPLDIADRVAAGQGVAVLGQRVQGQAKIGQGAGELIALQEPAGVESVADVANVRLTSLHPSEPFLSRRPGCCRPQLTRRRHTTSRRERALLERLVARLVVRLDLCDLLGRSARRGRTVTECSTCTASVTEPEAWYGAHAP